MKHFPTSRRKAPLAIEAAVDGRPMLFKGRFAWALTQLCEAGAQGCDPLKRPAPRWSEYVRRLRVRGVHIETILEPHGGPFPGNHGRYVLRSKVRLLPPKKGG